MGEWESGRGQPGRREDLVLAGSNSFKDTK